MTHQPTSAQWVALRQAEQHLLALSPIPIMARDVRIDDQPIHVLETGDPTLPPLVLIHGRGGAGALFATVLPLLAPHRHCYTIDLRGFGLSSRAPFTGTTPDAAMDWWRDGVLATIDALGLRHYDLLGHSLGGMVAINIALQRPEQISHLILEDTGGFPGTVPLLVRLYFNVSPEWMARHVPRRVFDAASQGSIPATGQTAAFRAAMLDFTYLLTTLPGTAESGSRAFNKILDLRGSHYSLSQRLGELRPTTRVLWGERDQVIPLAIVKAGIALIPEGDLVIIPGAGHSPHIEAPEDFTRQVLLHLARGAETLSHSPPRGQQASSG